MMRNRFQFTSATIPRGSSISTASINGKSKNVTQTRRRHYCSCSALSNVLSLLLLGVIASLLYVLHSTHLSCLQGDNSRLDIIKDLRDGNNDSSQIILIDSSSNHNQTNNDDININIPNKENDKSSSSHDWPGVAVDGVGYPLVQKGSNFVSTNNLRSILYEPKKSRIRGRSKERLTFNNLMEEFIHVYTNRPDKSNICGIRFNHALALFVSIRHLNPRLVIESGINAGQSTYFIRHAKKDMEVISLDPEDHPICGEKGRWIDESGKTKYYTGNNFVDIADFDWVTMANNGTITPSRTLVFLDDHQEVIRRFPSIMKAGISHVIVEDNYKRGQGATPMDRDGQTPKQLFAYRKKKDNGTLRDADWLFHNLISYAEFPPLVPPIMSKKYKGTRKPEGGFMFYNDTNTDIMPPLLRSDVDDNDYQLYLDIVTSLGYDPELKDQESYMQFMNYNQICYLEVLPMAWRIVDLW